MKRHIQFKPSWYHTIQKSRKFTRAEKRKVGKEWIAILKRDSRAHNMQLEDYFMWVNSVNEYKFWSNIHDIMKKKIDWRDYLYYFMVGILVIVNMISIGVLIFRACEELLK
jgi:hypothetical protein